MADSIEVLLEKISSEIKLGEERLSGKQGKIEFLEEKEELKTEFYKAIARTEKKLDAVNTRVNGLYIKVGGFSGVIVGIIELIARSS